MTTHELIWPLINSHQLADSPDHLEVSQYRGPKIHLVKLPIARKEEVKKRQISVIANKFLDMMKVSTNNISSLLAEILKQSGEMDKVLEKCNILQQEVIDPLKLRKDCNMSDNVLKTLIRGTFF